MKKNKFFSKKRLFHMLTNINANAAYSSEIYLEKNSDKLSSDPFRFLTDLARISYHYGIKNKNDAVKLSGKRECDFTNIYYRHKGTLVFKSLEKYKCIIVDVEQTLFYKVLKNEDIYRIVQQKNKTDGFLEERKKYDSSGMFIEKIYESINQTLGAELTPEYELKAYEKSVLKNNYISEIVDMLAANHIKTILVIRGCYQKEFYQELFKHKKISFSDDIVVTGVNGSGYIRFLKNLIKRVEKENKISAAECLVYSSNHKNCVKPLRSANFNSAYYYPAKMFYKKFDYPDMQYIQGEIYKNIVSYELYGCKSMKSKEYGAIFAYFAPVITDILEKISEYGRKNKIIFVGSNENIIYRLYKKYYNRGNEILTIDWSYFMAEHSADYAFFEDGNRVCKEKWNDIYDRMPSINDIPKDRIKYSLGDNKKDDAFNEKNTQYIDAYIRDSLDYFMEEMRESNKSNCGQNEAVIVDLTEQSSGGSSFLRKLKVVYPDLKTVYYSWYKEMTENIKNSSERNDDLIKSSDSIKYIDRILQRDVPVLLKISGEKISYVYPGISSITAYEKMEGALGKYIEKHLAVSTGISQADRFSVHDINEILRKGNAWLYVLCRGGI